MTGAGRAAETAVRGAEPLGPMVAGELERPPLPLLSLEVTVEFCDIEGGRNRGELAEAVPDFHGEVRHSARRQRPPLLSQQGREGPYRRPACRQATQEVARLALRRRGSRRRGRQVANLCPALHARAGPYSRPPGRLGGAGKIGRPRARLSGMNYSIRHHAEAVRRRLCVPTALALS
jgi:hypothetical protein